MAAVYRSDLIGLQRWMGCSPGNHRGISSGRHMDCAQHRIQIMQVLQKDIMLKMTTDDDVMKDIVLDRMRVSIENDAVTKCDRADGLSVRKNNVSFYRKNMLTHAYKPTPGNPHNTFTAISTHLLLLQHIYICGSSGTAGIMSTGTLQHSNQCVSRIFNCIIVSECLEASLYPIAKISSS